MSCRSARRMMRPLVSQASSHAYRVMRVGLPLSAASCRSTAWRSLSIAFPPPGTVMPDVHGAGGLGALCAKPPRCVPACRHYSASSSDGSAGAGAVSGKASAVGMSGKGWPALCLQKIAVAGAVSGKGSAVPAKKAARGVSGKKL